MLILSMTSQWYQLSRTFSNVCCLKPSINDTASVSVNQWSSSCCTWSWTVSLKALENKTVYLEVSSSFPAEVLNCALGFMRSPGLWWPTDRDLEEKKKMKKWGLGSLGRLDPLATHLWCSREWPENDTERVWEKGRGREKASGKKEIVRLERSRRSRDGKGMWK